MRYIYIYIMFVNGNLNENCLLYFVLTHLNLFTMLYELVKLCVLGLLIVNVVRTETTVYLDSGVFTRGRRISDGVFMSTEPIGLQMCLKLCLLQNDCNIVAYNINALICEHGRNNSNTEISETNWYITEQIDHPDLKISIKGCESVLCSIGERCVVLSNGGTTCVKINCEAPDTYSGLSISSNVSIVGSTVVYSCDITPISQETLSCAADGTWTKPGTLLCNGLNAFDQSLSTTAIPSGTCPSSFRLVNNNLEYDFCYALFDDVQQNHADAVTSCQQRGGHLLVIDSNRKRNKMFEDRGDPSGMSITAFVDGTDVAVEGTFVHYNGDLMGMQNNRWGNNEPGGGQTENCVFLNQGSMHDVSCDSNRDYICEINLS